MTTATRDTEPPPKTVVVHAATIDRYPSAVWRHEANGTLTIIEGTTTIIGLYAAGHWFSVHFEPTWSP